MKVAFRADASIQIGNGHVMRCLTLADELSKRGHECIFVCREHEGHLGNLVLSKGYVLHLLTKPVRKALSREVPRDYEYANWLGVTWTEDVSQTIDALSSFAPDWLVVDHYALDAKWEKQFAKDVGQIMVIDDLANRPHHCSVLLDQNLGRHKSEYEGLVPTTCELLIGPRYAMLRPEFAQLRQHSLKRRMYPELKRILISLGGVDQTNVTRKVLECLANSRLASETKIDVVMGANAPHIDNVKNYISGLSFNIKVSVNVSNMAKRMLLADLAIGAGGSSTWERFSLGLPSIIFILAENQNLLRNILIHEKVALSILDESNLDLLTGIINSVTKTDLQNCINRSKEVVDGLGVSRVAELLKE